MQNDLKILVLVDLDVCKNYQIMLQAILSFYSDVKLDIITLQEIKEEVLIEKLKGYKINKIINFIDTQNLYVETDNIAINLADIMQNYDCLFLDDCSFSKEIAARLAVYLDVQPIFNVIDYLKNDDIFVMKIYAGQFFVQIKSEEHKKIISLSLADIFLQNENKFEAKSLNEDIIVEYHRFKAIKQNKVEKIILNTKTKILDSEIVLSGGNGIKSKQVFDNLYLIADKMKAEVGGTKEALNNYYIKPENLIGYSGKTIKAKWYFAFGISGQPYHLAGIRGVKKIVSINVDKNAKINDDADYVLYQDCEEVLSNLISLIK